MGESYRIVISKDTGQGLLPMVELIEGSRMAIDEMIDILGRAGIEAVLQLSAQRLASRKGQGRKGEKIVWYGSQAGRVTLSDRGLKVKKPWLLRKQWARRGGRNPHTRRDQWQRGPAEPAAGHPCRQHKIGNVAAVCPTIWPSRSGQS